MHRYLRRRRIVTPTGRAAPLGAESADKRKNGTNDVKRFALERRRPFMLSRRVKECIGNLLAAFASEKTIRGNRGQIYYRKPPPPPLSRLHFPTSHHLCDSRDDTCDFRRRPDAVESIETGNCLAEYFQQHVVTPALFVSIQFYPHALLLKPRMT